MTNPDDIAIALAGEVYDASNPGSDVPTEVRLFTKLMMARAIMAEREAYLAVIRHSGEAIEASSFQMLMENYIQARTDERLKIAVMALTLVATMSDKPTRKVAMGALAQLGETQ